MKGEKFMWLEKITELLPQTAGEQPDYLVNLLNLASEVDKSWDEANEKIRIAEELKASMEEEIRALREENDRLRDVNIKALLYHSVDVEKKEEKSSDGAKIKTIEEIKEEGVK